MKQVFHAWCERTFHLSVSFWKITSLSFVTECSFIRSLHPTGGPLCGLTVTYEWLTSDLLRNDCICRMRQSRWPQNSTFPLPFLGFSSLSNPKLCVQNLWSLGVFKLQVISSQSSTVLNSALSSLALKQFCIASLTNSSFRCTRTASSILTRFSDLSYLLRSDSQMESPFFQANILLFFDSEDSPLSMRKNTSKIWCSLTSAFSSQIDETNLLNFFRNR